MASIGSISSSGQFINIDKLVQNSVRVQQNRLTEIQNKQNNANTTISNLGKIKSQLSSLYDKFQAINTASSNYVISGVSTGLSNVTATANGNYNISIDSLASGQITTSKVLSSSSSQALGMSGNIKIDIGKYNGNTFDISENGQGSNIEIKTTDTLKDIQDKLNASGQVNTSIIIGGDGYHLSFSSIGIGQEQAFKISVDDPTNSGLNNLSFHQGQSNSYIENVSAKNAQATVNGIALTSSNNIFTGVQNFNFTATQPMAIQNINVKRDNSAITKALNEFVTAYNTTNQSLKNTNNNSNNQLATFGSQLRGAFNNVDYDNSLSQIGVTFDKSGLMSFDSSKFNSYINSDKNVSDLIGMQFSKESKGAKIFNTQLELGGIIDAQTTSLTTQNNKLIKDIANTQDVLSQQQQQYRNQYATLDAYLSTLNDNSSTVSQLMASLNKNNA